MKRIKINGEPYNVPSVSELTFNQFNDIIVIGKVTDLREYIALFTNIEIGDLMKSEFSGASLPALNKMIFNVDIDSVMTDKKNVVKFKEEFYSMDELNHATFGKDYFFDLYHSRQKAEQINFFQLCMYSLAVALASDTDGMTEIGKNYERLCNRNWMEVLPQGFFLAKKYSKGTKDLMRLWANCILPLKVTKWKTYILEQRLITREKI